MGENSNFTIYGYVYKTTNKVNNKIYIGRRVGIFVDWYLGSGTHLKRAIKKYGKENFRVELIEYSNSNKDLDAMEKKYIQEYRNKLNVENVYNMASGGDGASPGEFNHMYGRTGINHPSYGKKRLDVTLRMLSDKNPIRGKFGKQSPTFGEKNGMFGMTGDKHPLFGKKRPDVSERIGEKHSMFGKKHTEEAKIKMHLSWKKNEDKVSSCD